MIGDTKEGEFVGFAKGEYIASIIAIGRKPSKAAIAIDELLPLLTRDELERVRLEILAMADPAERREILREMHACPFCERWMGHNKPPADEPQSSFDFDQR